VKKTGSADHSLDLIELGALVIESFDPTPPVYRSYPVYRSSVEATEEDEARLQVERLLAGRFDHQFVAVVETKRRK